jgi:two-component system, sensor histidine kinase RetS
MRWSWRLQPSPQKGIEGIRWLLLLLMLVSAQSFAAPLIKLTKNFTQVNLTDYVDLLADPDQQLTIDRIAREPIVDNFAPANRPATQHADRNSAYWLRFGIHNPLNETRLLVLNPRSPDEVSIAAFTGSLQPLPIERTPLLQLLIPPQSKQIYYLRIGPGALELSHFELLSIERYLKYYRTRTWLNGVAQGGMVLVAIAAFFTGALRRDSSYWWLVGYCMVLTVFQIFYRADFNPLIFKYAPSWQFRHPLLQTCLLLSNICSIRLAQCLPITQHKSSEAHPLMLLLIGTALAIPILFLLQPFAGATLVLCLSALTITTTIVIALYNFLLTHRRTLLYYALIRLSILSLTIGGGIAWHINNSIRVFTDNMLPFAMTAEAIGLFALLLWHSFEQQRQHANNERNIAVLEAEARSHTEIVAEVGHRLRTPISGVFGMLDMLQDTSLSAMQSDYANTIRRAANELLNVVDEISDVSRLQTHAAKLQQNIFDPHVLVTECVDGFRSAAAAHHLELINDLAPELPTYVSGDLTRLRQIILQLLHQAVSHYERGEIVLSAKQLLQGNWLRFDIQTRAAIAVITPSDIDRRINPPGAENMRIAIAHQLVAMLGGRIRIKDLTDGNLHAWFDLPLPTVERNAPVTVLDTTLQGKRLLVIDDNATFCDVIVRQLSHWGMTVFTAHSASEALARVRNQITLSQPIDVLLIDTDIPELRQSEWAQRLRYEVEPWPIVILLSSEPRNSADASPRDLRRVLLKPVNHTSLKITLIEAFKQREQCLLPASRVRNEPIRCLFAEDNLINAKVLAGMLDKLGVVYTATSNGQEAVDACHRNRFDIVLMDGDMPVMDGWEASRRIRELFENRGEPSIPIIALTANTVEELGERARQLVMDAHLVKPIRLQSLRELLEQWTGKIVTLPSELPN